jgi:ubiquitin-like protein Pup
MAQTKQAEKISRAGDGSTQGPAPRAAQAGPRSSDAVDRLVDDIDRVLEENAEAFVRGYVQRGGE